MENNIKDRDFLEFTQVTPVKGLKIAKQTRLVGNSFQGSTLDTNAWTATNANGGTSAIAGGLLTVRSNTTANGSSKLASNKVARFIGTNVNYFRAVARFGDGGVTNNVRRLGAFDDNNGVFFELNGATFGVGTRKATTDTVITSATTPDILSAGRKALPLETDFHLFEIYWTTNKVWFLIDGITYRRVNITDATWADTQHLKLRAESINSGGATTDCQLIVQAMSISMLGELETSNRFYNLANANETRVLKYAPGRLKRVVANNPAATGTVTIYDNTAGSGTIIALLNVAGIDTGTTLEYDVDFSTGLTYVSAGSPGDFTFVFD